MDVQLKNILKGHSASVDSVAIDGDVVVSGSADKTVKVWSAASGECLKTFEGHSSYVSSVAINGDMVVSGSYDKTVKVWSATSGKCLKTLKGHSEDVNSVAIDGDFIVSGSDDKTIKIWSTTSGKCLKTLREHADCVRSVAIDGDIVASGSKDSTIKLWSVTSGECLQTFRGDYVAVDGDTIVCVDGELDAPGILEVWIKKSGKHSRKKLRGHSKDVESLAIYGDLIVSGASDKTVKIWSLKSGKCLFTLTGHSRFVTSVACDGDHIVSGSEDKTVIIWETGKRHKESVRRKRNSIRPKERKKGKTRKQYSRSRIIVRRSSRSTAGRRKFDALYNIGSTHCKSYVHV